MKRLPLLLTLVVLCGCSMQDSQDFFIPESRAAGGVYEFRFPLSDSLCTYDFLFYTRVDGKWQSSIRLDASWLSPEGKSFTETVYMAPSGAKDAAQIYRSGVVPASLGDWKLSVSVSGIPRGFRGLGLTIEKNGTRQTEEIR